MTTLNYPASNLHAGMQTPLRARMHNAAPPLYWVGLAMLLLSIPILALSFLDARQLQGVSVWLKSFKFQLSTGVYLLTLALLMVWLPAAALLASAALALGILIARNPAYNLPPAITLAIVLGLGLTFFLGAGFGSYLGGQHTGHWVGGVLSDSGGLPLFTWSRSGGDLRVAHFFGIHAMHFIPAFALALGLARGPQVSAIRAVWVFAFAFKVFCVWTFLQARNGMPFLA